MVATSRFLSCSSRMWARKNPWSKSIGTVSPVLAIWTRPFISSNWPVLASHSRLCLISNSCIRCQTCSKLKRELLPNAKDLFVIKSTVLSTPTTVRRLWGSTMRGASWLSRFCTLSAWVSRQRTSPFSISKRRRAASLIANQSQKPSVWTRWEARPQPKCSSKILPSTTTITSPLRMSLNLLTPRSILARACCRKRGRAPWPSSCVKCPSHGKSSRVVSLTRDSHLQVNSAQPSIIIRRHR